MIKIIPDNHCQRCHCEHVTVHCHVSMLALTPQTVGIAVLKYSSI